MLKLANESIASSTVKKNAMETIRRLVEDRIYLEHYLEGCAPPSGANYVHPHTVSPRAITHLKNAMGKYGLDDDKADNNPLTLVQRLETKIDALRDREARRARRESIQELLDGLQTDYRTNRPRVAGESSSGCTIFCLLSGQHNEGDYTRETNQRLYREAFEQAGGISILANMAKDRTATIYKDQDSRALAIRWAATILIKYFPNDFPNDLHLSSSSKHSLPSAQSQQRFTESLMFVPGVGIQEFPLEFSSKDKPTSSKRMTMPRRQTASSGRTRKRKRTPNASPSPNLGSRKKRRRMGGSRPSRRRSPLQRTS